jgi:predicted PurR-regulated permease PerM
MDRPLLIVLTVIAVFFALHFGRPILLPVAFALFLIGLLWPLMVWFRRWMHRTLAFVATLLAFIACLWAFGWVTNKTARVAIERWPHYQPRFEELSSTWRERATSWGFSVGGDDAGREGEPSSSSASSSSSSSSKGPARAILGSFMAFVEGALLTFALMALGLLEIEAYANKIARAAPSAGSRFLAAARRVSSRFGRYFYTRTVMGVIQGVATGLFAWAVGLDLPLVWGLLSALLNYIPTIGSVLAVVPPSLFALVQFPQSGKALLVVGGLAAVQIILGNYVDPRIQGRWLSLSPVVVLLSVAFWGWLWGPAGALIAVPITLAMVIAGQEFPSLRPLSILLASEPEEDDGKDRA